MGRGCGGGDVRVRASRRFGLRFESKRLIWGGLFLREVKDEKEVVEERGAMMRSAKIVDEESINEREREIFVKGM